MPQIWLTMGWFIPCNSPSQEACQMDKVFWRCAPQAGRPKKRPRRGQLRPLEGPRTPANRDSLNRKLANRSVHESSILLRHENRRSLGDHSKPCRRVKVAREGLAKLMPRCIAGQLRIRENPGAARVPL
jgi:hypothetical protein